MMYVKVNQATESKQTKQFLEEIRPNNFITAYNLLNGAMLGKPKVGLSMVLVHEKSEINKGSIVTTPVKSIEKFKNKIIVKTANSLYVIHPRRV